MYEKAKIYKLQCDDGYYYIGSTCNTLAKRFSGHKYSKDNTRKNKHLNEVGWERVKIILIEEFPCETKEQLHRREDELICERMNDEYCLNRNRVGTLNALGVEGYRKQWNETHREYKREQGRIYHQEHREEINRKHRERWALKKSGLQDK